MKKIYYMAYYSDPNNIDRKAVPAADMKVDYIAGAMKKIGYKVVILSMCGVDKRDKVFQYHKGYSIKKNGIKIVFYPSISSKYRVIRVLGRVITRLLLYKDLLNRFHKQKCKLIIYHSLGVYKIVKFLNRIGIQFILEVEEIYADVWKKHKRWNLNKEMYMFTKAEAYILSTFLLYERLRFLNKKAIVCNGTYKVEKERYMDSDKKEVKHGNIDTIHCVYAGTFDPRKGGIIAAQAAEFLPSYYHIHILGFGSDEDTNQMKAVVKKLQNICKCKITFEGCLTGEDYIRFIQTCHIGLSPQDPNAEFNSTSFPSKILSYLANGLRVVSIRIPAIEQSAVAEVIYFYDKQTPQEIAKAIMQVNIHDNYDSRKIVEKLNNEFEKELDDLLKEGTHYKNLS